MTEKFGFSRRSAWTAAFCVVAVLSACKGTDTKPEEGKPVAEAVYRLGRLTASYIHFYLPSNPRAATELLLP